MAIKAPVLTAVNKVVAINTVVVSSRINKVAASKEIHEQRMLATSKALIRMVAEILEGISVLSPG